MSAITQMVEDLRTLREHDTRCKSITFEKFEQWKKQYSWDALGLEQMRYGQAFCFAFHIHDKRLWHEPSLEKCDHIIQREWLTGN